LLNVLGDPGACTWARIASSEVTVALNGDEAATKSVAGYLSSKTWRRWSPPGSVPRRLARAPVWCDPASSDRGAKSPPPMASPANNLRRGL